MTTDLTPWNNHTSDRPNWFVPRAEREHAARVDALVRTTKLAGLRVDAEAALTGRIMERTVDRDSHRRALANGDPVLDSVLTRIEVGFVDKALRHQRDFGTGWSS